MHRRLLAQVPDDVDAVVFLFKYHAKRDEALVARDYALRARRLKPASEEMLGMVVWGHLSAARTLRWRAEGRTPAPSWRLSSRQLPGLDSRPMT